MTEIKRWEVDFHGDEFLANPQGEWVRWEDVEKIIKAASKQDNNPPPWYYGSPFKGGVDG